MANKATEQKFIEQFGDIWCEEDVTIAAQFADQRVLDVLRELVEENRRLREALEKIRDMRNDRFIAEVRMFAASVLDEQRTSEVKTDGQ